MDPMTAEQLVKIVQKSRRRGFVSGSILTGMTLMLVSTTVAYYESRKNSPSKQFEDVAKKIFRAERGGE